MARRATEACWRHVEGAQRSKRGCIGRGWAPISGELYELARIERSRALRATKECVTPRAQLAGAALLAFLQGCGASNCPPTHGEPEPPATAGNENEAPLRGTYRIVQLAGQPVVDTLVHDRSCYAGRALFAFGADELTFSLETACAGNDRYETVCMAELTTSIEWDGDGFRIPTAARARGMVSQYFQPPTPEEAVALADGETADGHDFDDACHVGVVPMHWRIARRAGDALELVNEQGDTMTLQRETSPRADWGTLTRQARRQRVAHGT
jgi:hypothetical protein